MKPSLFIFVIWILAGLAIAVYAQPVVPSAPAGVGAGSGSARSAGSTAPLSSAENDYVLTPGDTIEMSIFREPDMTIRATVGRDGTVQLPLLGEVKLGGLPIRDARARLVKMYDAKYIANPQVYLNVVEFARRQFTILGQVLRPGSYELKGGETINLLEAIGMAGGFTRIADQGRISIRRDRDGQSEAIKANAKRIASGKDETVVIRPGDVITVGESWY